MEILKILEINKLKLRLMKQKMLFQLRKMV